MIVIGKKEIRKKGNNKKLNDVNKKQKNKRE